LPNSVQASQPLSPSQRISRENIAVAIRCRPSDAPGPDAWRLSPTEGKIAVNQHAADAPALKRVTSELEANRGQIANLSIDKAHKFDMVFDDDASTRQVYKAAAQPIVMSALDGVNGAILAYGQVCTSLALGNNSGRKVTAFLHVQLILKALQLKQRTSAQVLL
jgi:Kinesin motor domain